MSKQMEGTGHLRHILCPGTDGLTKQERIRFIMDQFDKWIHTPELTDVIGLFTDEKIPHDSDTLTYLTWLKEFVRVWDYRATQSQAKTAEGENARWLITSSDYVLSHGKEIMDAAYALGMISCEQTDRKPDYILALGGAVRSNWQRNIRARNVCDEESNSPGIVCLSTMRVLSDSERDDTALTLYAKDCIYEFDSMCRAAELIYDLGGSFTETRCDDEDPDRTWVIRRYDREYKGSPVTVIAAPSSDPDNRRANSADCFEFFFDRFEIPEGTMLLNTTTEIYCPYQQVRALKYAIDRNVIFDTVGYVSDKPPANYLQEIKSTVDAMYDFAVEFIRD